MHEAVFEDVFGDDRGAFGLRHEGHVLGLHVGGEAGVFLGGHVDGVEAAAGVNADVVLADLELDAALFKLCDDGAEVRGVAAVDVEVAAGDGAGDEEGAGLNAVRIDAVLGAVELWTLL